MAKTVTLAQLRTDSRLYADERPGGSSAFINDDEVTRLVNLEASSLYDRLIAARGAEYYRISGTFNTVAGTASYSLAARFMEMLWVGIPWTSQYTEEVFPFQHSERSALDSYAVWAQGSPKAYQLTGTTTITLKPTPTTVQAVNYEYVPAYLDMSDDADTFDAINGWEDVITLAVAVKMRVIGDKPITELMGLLERANRRVDEMAANLDAGHAKQVNDVDASRRGFGRRFSPWH